MVRHQSATASMPRKRWRYSKDGMYRLARLNVLPGMHQVHAELLLKHADDTEPPDALSLNDNCGNP